MPFNAVYSLNCTLADVCEFDCVGQNTCRDQYIDCGDSRECLVNCESKNSCKSATINAKLSAYLHVTMTVPNDFNVAAENGKIYCPVDGNNTRNCKITCNGNSHTCNYLDIYAVDGSLVCIVVLSTFVLYSFNIPILKLH